MLASLKFAQGSVAKKDFVPSLTHFRIEDGKVRGYNGILAISTPLPFNITCNPKAEPLIRAITNCVETVQMTMTAGGRLSIKSGKFKAFIDCIEGESPHVLPSGQTVEIDGAAILKAFKTLYPVIGDDASRPWSNGVLLSGQSAFATNNVVLCEYWTGLAITDAINVPRAAIKEMLRVNEPPISFQMDENSLTAHYSGDRWIRTQLLETKWPDLQKVLNRKSAPAPIEPLIFEGLQVVKPFCDKIGRIAFRDGKICTHDGDAEGASYDIEGFDANGVYAHDMLKLLDGLATSIDWTTYPNPCMFFGENVRGAIVGMRQ